LVALIRGRVAVYSGPIDDGRNLAAVRFSDISLKSGVSGADVCGVQLEGATSKEIGLMLSYRQKVAGLAVAGGLLLAGATAAAADFNASGSVQVDPGAEVIPPTVTPPQVTPPQITGPSASLPEVTKAPSVSGPQVTMPEVKATPPSAILTDEDITVTVPRPQVTGPDVTAPSATAPEVSEPSVTGPQATEPSVTGPQVSGPSVNITPGSNSVQVSAEITL
jgi:hypothetical protein